MTEAIKVDGLKGFVKSIKQLDADLPKALRVAFNGATDVVVDEAKPKVPRGASGKARASVKSRSTRTEARVVGGGNKAPWYPWLDFGGEGRVRGRPAPRPFIKNGRYIYNAFFTNRERFGEMLQDSLVDIARQAGLEVDRG